MVGIRNRTHTHLDQFLMSRCSRPHGKSFGNPDSSRLVIFECGSIWRLTFPLDKSSARLRGELRISRHHRSTGGCGFQQRRRGLWRRWRRLSPSQHDTRHLVLTNTPSCHYAPHVPESTSLCLFIHYLLCSPNKVRPVRGTLRAEASAEDLNGGAVSGNKSAGVEG